MNNTTPTIWFTSDTHYGHANVIKYSNRPFKDTDEMRETMINNWNSVVKPQDLVYHIGDVAFLKEPQIDAVLGRLAGNKYLIYGNHDHAIKKSKTLQQHFIWCRDYAELTVDFGGMDIKIVLHHFPIMSWNKMHRGSWHVHGHCHHNLRYPFKGRIIDVGVDGKDYDFTPLSVADIGKRFSSVIPESLDHHTE